MIGKNLRASFCFAQVWAQSQHSRQNTFFRLTLANIDRKYIWAEIRFVLSGEEPTKIISILVFETTQKIGRVLFQMKDQHSNLFDKRFWSFLDTGPTSLRRLDGPSYLPSLQGYPGAHCGLWQGLTSKTIVEILQRLLLLLPAHPGHLGVLRVGVVVKPELVQRLGRLVLPGSVALGIGRRHQGLDNPGDVLRRLLRLLKTTKNRLSEHFLAIIFISKVNITIYSFVSKSLKRTKLAYFKAEEKISCLWKNALA